MRVRGTAQQLTRSTGRTLWSGGGEIRILELPADPEMPMHSDDDPLADFELPPDVMSSTFEHAISDAAAIAHERGHAVASALQRKLKGSLVDYSFSGIVTAHLRSGAVARCGGPVAGWRLTIERPGGETQAVDIDLAPGETDTKVVAERIAKVLKRW